MKNLIHEDLTGEKLNRLIETIDDIFMDMDENENET